MPNPPNMPNLPTGEDEEEEAAAPAVDAEEEEDVSVAEEEESEASGAEEEWDLTKIFTIKELNKKKPTMCDRANDGDVNCGLVACSRWESEGRAPWNSCLDCQVK